MISVYSAVSVVEFLRYLNGSPLSHRLSAIQNLTLIPMPP